MPLATLQFPSMEEMLAFVDIIGKTIHDSDIDYDELIISATFTITEIELAKSAYGAVSSYN